MNNNDDFFNYELMVEDALRSVIKTTLLLVAEHGLPGESHLYITFRTDYEGVGIPAYLKTKYPDEMTIVLQYKFWDLVVEDTYFKVTLSFNKVNEELIIPYQAVTGFADPAANFGLRFEADFDDDALDDEYFQDELDLHDEPAPSKTNGGKNKSKSKKDAPLALPNQVVQKKDTADVISLDAFRKKP